MIWLLLVIFILPLCCIAAWFVAVSKASDERYERELDRIYGRRRK
jgi:hypothetical protein